MEIPTTLAESSSRKVLEPLDQLRSEAELSSLPPGNDLVVCEDKVY